MQRESSGPPLLEIALGYCFFGSEGQARIVILVARERDKRVFCAVYVSEKGIWEDGIFLSV